MIHELRTYEAAPGKMGALQARFRDHTLDFFKQFDIEVTGFWTYGPGGGGEVVVVGPIARTVYDAAVALDVLAGPTVEDLATYAAQGHIPEDGYAAALEDADLAGKRFGLVGVGWRERFLPLDPATEEGYQIGRADV